MELHKLTHLDMSLAIKRTIEYETGIRLDTLGFMYGNIKPDLSPYLISIPHFKHKSLNFIISEINYLLKYKVSKETKCTREFSERLGVVTHYLSDFFCYVHSKEYKGNVVFHYMYEVGLCLFCKRNLHILKTYKYSKYPISSINQKTICDSIEKLYEKCRMNKPSYTRDLIYALRMSTSLILSIISVCMTDTLETAA